MRLSMLHKLSTKFLTKVLMLVSLFAKSRSGRNAIRWQVAFLIVNVADIGCETTHTSVFTYICTLTQYTEQ